MTRRSAPAQNAPWHSAREFATAAAIRICSMFIHILGAANPVRRLSATPFLRNWEKFQSILNGDWKRHPRVRTYLNRIPHHCHSRQIGQNAYLMNSPYLSPIKIWKLFKNNRKYISLNNHRSLTNQLWPDVVGLATISSFAEARDNGELPKVPLDDDKSSSPLPHSGRRHSILVTEFSHRQVATQLERTIFQREKSTSRLTELLTAHTYLKNCWWTSSVVCIFARTTKITFPKDS